jgi:hypothetical protein
MTPTTINRRVGLVATGTALSWLGFYIHNVADLPGQTLLSPETGLPTLVTLVLFRPADPGHPGALPRVVAFSI